MKRYCIEIKLEMDGKNPPWSRMYEFEKTFTDFLKSRGVQAEKIEYPVDSPNCLSLFLTPIQEPVIPPRPQTPPGKILKKLQGKK